MKRLTLLLLLLPTFALANPLGDAFSAYVKIRRAQIRMEMGSLSEQESKQVPASLTEARIEFQAVLRSDQANLESWEKSVLDRVETLAQTQPTTKKSAREPKPQFPLPSNPQALAFLQANFPSPRELSPLEWRVIGEWFGPVTRDEFLKKSYSLAELPAAGQGEREAPLLVWVKNPYRGLLENSEDLDKAELEKIQPGLFTAEISAFPKVADQAEELRHLIVGLGNKHFVLVSAGEGSAVVLKLLDLYPGMREKENIRGWVNVNGRLFGHEPKREPKQGRGLASLPDQFSADMLRDLNALHLESLIRSTPLGEGFPIVNLVSLEKYRRAGASLRESLVAEGSSWFVPKGSAAKQLRSVFPLLTP